MRGFSSLSLTACLLASIAAAATIPSLDVNIESKNKTGKAHKPKPSKATGTLPPQINSVEIIDLISDGPFNPSIYRDGGGGGYINGYNIISFSDSFTTGGNVLQNYTSFVHNSFAYFGVNKKNNPTKVFDFGSQVHPETGYRTFLSTGLNAQGNETTAPNTNVAVWPNSNMIPMSNGNSAMAVYNVYNLSSGAIIYNTVAQIDVVSPHSLALAPGNTITANRIVPRFFYATENLYGSFATYTSLGAKGEPSDPNIYFLSTSSTGIKLARAPSASPTDRSTFRYYYPSDGTWARTQPRVSNTLASILSWSYTNPYDGSRHGPGTGDVFWSVYYGTYLLVFQSDGISSAFFVSYSESGVVEGPWSEPVQFWNPPVNSMCTKWSPNWNFNYAGHAYPSWDPTGQTLLISWSSCNAWTSMATVTFGK